jgi:hypothetical protein
MVIIRFVCFNYHQGMPVTQNNCPNCLVTGERYGMWYTFTVYTAGTVNFTITPVNTADDYDYGVWRLGAQ